MHALFCIFFRFWYCKNYWNRLRFDRAAAKCTLLRFMNHGKNVGFNFQVRCAHKSGDVVNFTTVVCRISSRLKWYKNYKNRLRLAKVIVQNILPHFLCSLCIMRNTVQFFWNTLYIHFIISASPYDTMRCDTILYINVLPHGTRKRVMKNLKPKNRDAQKKRSSHKVRGVSPEAGMECGKYLWKK